jgi:hypothetical protein
MVENSKKSEQLAFEKVTGGMMTTCRHETKEKKPLNSGIFLHSLTLTTL